MHARARLLHLLPFLVVGIAAAAPAHADDNRYVSATGSNTNACTLAAPCKTLQHAISRTPAGGELHVLESGNYGPGATIDKSMTISADGHTVFLNGAVTINGAAANVVLRAIVLNGVGATADGIDIVTAATVAVEHCEILGFSEYGLYLTSTNTRLFVTGTNIHNNPGTGLSTFPGGTTKIAIDDSRFENNGSLGVAIEGASTVATITHSVVANNLGNGILAYQAHVDISRTTAANNNGVGFYASAGGELTLESSEAYGNSSGLSAMSGGVARVSNSAFSHNLTGISNQSSTIYSRGNNLVSGNTTNTSGALTALGGL